MGIFKLIANDSTKDFAKEIVSMSVSEILKKTGELASNFPVVAAVLAFWETGNNIHDAFLLRDLSDFFYGIYEGRIDDDNVIGKVADVGHASELLEEFTIRLISTNNKPGQTRLLGWLYYAKATGEITEEEYLRLSVYIHGCFISDLQRLKDFVDGGANRDHVSDSFYRAGLLQITDLLWGGGTVCNLSDLGHRFYDILKKHNFFGC